MGNRMAKVALSTYIMVIQNHLNGYKLANVIVAG